VKTEFNGIPETKHKQGDLEYTEYCSGISSESMETLLNKQSYNFGYLSFTLWAPKGGYCREKSHRRTFYFCPFKEHFRNT